MKEQFLFDFEEQETEELAYDGPINVSCAVTNISEILTNEINELPLEEKVEALNAIKELMHDISPFKTEPVDLIKWVPVSEVVKNDYNPNAVAPPEMELLRHSINHDGYTQPVVTWMSDEKDSREVIDGFHRSRVCREFKDVHDRVKGYLPVVTMRDDNTGQNDRVASTIRHNRARGKHKVESMSEIVVDLKKRNWTDKRICKELGMDPDEVLRLCQVSGLLEIFEDGDFTDSWDVGIFDDEDLESLLVDDLEDKEDE
jgi:ParB-like chromosome segregation protein Spo0J